MRSIRVVLVPLIFLFFIVAARPAEAQRRFRGRPVVRSSVVVVAGYPYYRYPLYDPWYQWGPYGPPGPYYGRRVDDLTATVRLAVKPREAEVLVDGYSAGTVNDFDGVFQRLRLRPGGHEIVVYLEGYRTERRNLYLSPGSSQKIEFDMERLSAGERSEPPPPPARMPMADDDPQAPRRPIGPPPRPAPRRPDRSSARFGTLSIRVQPADAEIVIDGERWDAPGGQDRIAIELAEGRHQVEVRKSGFATYTEEVLIRAGASLTLNVSLLR
jgi:hypothetical protein